MDENYTPNLDGLRIIKLLYKTKLSKIWLAQLEQENSDFFILKGKHIKSLGQYDIESFKRERKFLETNKSDLCPKFIKAYKDSEYVYMLLNFFEGIPLSEIIRENIITLNEYNLNNYPDFAEKQEIFKFLAFQLALILQELNNKNFIHRDIKLNNIIINKSLKISLIDFGFWKDLDNKDGRTNTLCGTFHSMSPEIFLVDNVNYGLEIDVYSFGVFLYEFFSRNAPFPYFFNDADLENFVDFEKSKLNENEDLDPFKIKAHKYYFKYHKNFDFKVDESEGLFYSVVKEDREENTITNNSIFIEEKLRSEIQIFIKNLKNLIESCMKFNPKERISATDILKHEFFKGFDYQKAAGKYTKFSTIDKNKLLISSESTLSKLLELITFNGEFKEDYALNSKFEDIFDKYF